MTTTCDEVLTAMCLWEEILTKPTAGSAAYLEVAGTSDLREVVMEWALPCHQDWEEADFDDSFDWEWCPKWITANVIWNGVEPPTLRGYDHVA